MIRITQTLAVRLFHALNLLALVCMIASGWEIYSANPVFGGRGAWPGPEFLRMGGWLAGGRHIHFFFMWILALNLLVYGLYLLISGHWRRRYPTLKDLKAIGSSSSPQRIRYAWHRITILLMILVSLMALYTGLGMYKPVQLAWIVDSVGGDWQALRISHFIPVVAIPALALFHVALGFSVGGWSLLQSIIVDGYRRRA